MISGGEVADATASAHAECHAGDLEVVLCHR